MARLIIQQNKPWKFMTLEEDVFSLEEGIVTALLKTQELLIKYEKYIQSQNSCTFMENLHTVTLILRDKRYAVIETA